MNKKKSKKKPLTPDFSRYRAILEAVPDIIMEVDSHKVYTWANQAGIDFFGDDVIGREAAEFFIGDQNTYEQMQPLFRGNEEIIYVESRQRRRDGQARLLAWWCKVLKDELGTVIGALSTARDITDVRQAVLRVSESEERFRAIFNYSADGIILSEPDMKFLMVNKSICTMTGYDEKELVGMSVNDFHPAEQLAAVKETFIAQLKGEIFAAPDIPVLRKDGSVFFADIHSTAFTLNDKKYIVGFFRDVSERNRILEALQESETHFRAMVEASPMGMHIYRVEPGKAPVFVGFNPAAEKILGVGHEQFMHKPITEAFPGLAGTEVPERYRRAALQGELWHNEQVEYQDNQLRGAFDVYAFRIKPGLMAAMFNDITSRKLMEEELRSQREFINRIMATSPVCIVMVDTNGRITYANDAAERAKALTRQLLAFSRKQPLEITVLNVNEIIESIQTLLDHTLRENIKVRLDLSRTLCNVKADHSQIDQIILNLASNAQDALPSGGEITVKTFNIVINGTAPPPGAMPGPGEYAVLSIADNGQGMDKETMEHIFEPFFTTKEKGVGTGLGLATVYGIVKQHGGHIHVRSEAGSGTVFDIYFPAVRENASPVPEFAGEPGGAVSSEIILLVEDNDDVRVMTERLLTSFGYQVIPAENGRRALDLFAQHPGIVLVITDVIMPDMNGVMLFQTIKSTNPLTKVLYMSGYTDDVIASHGALDKDSLLIMKPFTVGQLQTKVQQALQS